MTRNLNIRCADFKDNAKLILGDLRHDNDFSDVTLVCEDGRQVEAHKVILASSSPFFKNLLARNKHSHPLIFMRRVTSEVLLAILDFLYLGETSLPEQGLDFFLALAQELQLKGLSGKTTEDPKSHSRTTNNDLGDPLEGSQPRVENELAQDIKAEAVEVENKTEHFLFWLTKPLKAQRRLRNACDFRAPQREERQSPGRLFSRGLFRAIVSSRADLVLQLQPRRGQNGKSRGIAEDESKEGERTPWLLRERSRQRSGGGRLHGGHHLSRSWLLLASNPFFSRQEDSPKCTCQNASILIDEDRRPLVKHERP